LNKEARESCELLKKKPRQIAVISGRSKNFHEKRKKMGLQILGIKVAKMR